MKLVTGIEAIQSGKPWKHKNKDSWKHPSDSIGNLTSYDLLVKEFIIKEEPREFWIYLDSVGNPVTTTIENKYDKPHWIKVREVE